MIEPRWADMSSEILTGISRTTGKERLHKPFMTEQLYSDTEAQNVPLLSEFSGGFTSLS